MIVKLKPVLHESLHGKLQTCLKQLIDEAFVRLRIEVCCSKLDLNVIGKLSNFLKSSAAVLQTEQETAQKFCASSISVLFLSTEATTQNFVELSNFNITLIQILWHDSNSIHTVLSHPNMQNFIAKICGLIQPDLYTIEEWLAPATDLFGNIIELLIKYYSNSSGELSLRAIAAIDFAFLKTMLEVNYYEHLQPRIQ